MGAYRLLLAILVAISHAGIGVFGYNQGSVAVISFFLLSGFVMTGLVKRYYNDWRLIPEFYLDRISKLFPQFLFYILCVLVALYFTRFNTPFLSDVTPINICLNILMLPLGIYMYDDLGGCLLIPQAWSLGLEVSFYLLIPFILTIGGFRIAFVSSLSVFLCAYFGIIHTEFFGFRLLPGTLFIFLCGSMIFENRKHALLIGPIILIWVGAFLLFIFTKNNYMKEVLLGFVVGLPIVWLLRNQKVPREIDEWMGNMSYGVFLNHFLIIWGMQKLFGWHNFDSIKLIAMLLASVIFSMVTFMLVEKPILKLRRRLREKLKTTGSTMEEKIEMPTMQTDVAH